MKESLKNSDRFELKDVLFILAVILIILQSYQMYKVYKNPCDYCVIREETGVYTCKEFFNKFYLNSQIKVPFIKNETRKI